MSTPANLHGTLVRCVAGHYYANTREDEECPQCATLESFVAEARKLRDENQRLRDALAWMYDKWNDGDSCYEDPEKRSGFCGRAFTLEDSEEDAILELIGNANGELPAAARVAAMSETVTAISKFSFCETLTAGGSSPWHIRRLTAKGQRLSGFPDTPSLCGRAVAWDICAETDDHHLGHCCRACAAAFQQEQWR